jgi:hypothetical protein
MNRLCDVRCTPIPTKAKITLTSSRNVDCTGIADIGVDFKDCGCGSA